MAHMSPLRLMDHWPIEPRGLARPLGPCKTCRGPEWARALAHMNSPRLRPPWLKASIKGPERPRPRPQGPRPKGPSSPGFWPALWGPARPSGGPERRKPAPRGSGRHGPRLSFRALRGPGRARKAEGPRALEGGRAAAAAGVGREGGVEYIRHTSKLSGARTPARSAAPAGSSASASCSLRPLRGDAENAEAAGSMPTPPRPSRIGALQPGGARRQCCATDSGSRSAPSSMSTSSQQGVEQQPAGRRHVLQSTAITWAGG